MYSGIVFQFGTDRNEAIAPSARSTEEISPVLSNKCAQAITRRVPEAISICGDARDRARKDKRVLPGEIATVEQEYGVALLLAGKHKEAKEALDAALGAARERLARHPAESAKMLWARALANCQLGDTTDAIADFRAAEGKFEEALQGPAGGIEPSYRKHLEILRANGKECER
jgi:tetratricopeptide (TPR) repeat protein